MRDSRKSIVAKTYAVALLILAVLAACMTRKDQYMIEVKGSDSSDQRIERAKEIVTEQRLQRLKVQLKQRLSTVTDSQLALLGLSWRQMHFASFNGKSSRDAVTVTLTIEHDDSFDGKAILEAARAIIEPEVNPP